MNRELNKTIELGRVSTDTKGVLAGTFDEEGGLQIRMGLSDD